MIFLREPENFLFGIWQYHAMNLTAEMTAMAANLETQRWWALTDPCQEPPETRGEGEWWAMMEEVFHHD